MAEAGEIMAGRFRVIEVLSGGMGEVLICELIHDKPEVEQAHTAEGKPGPRLALKTFQRRYFFENAIRQSFVKEATIWMRLSGLPYIMPVLGIEHIGDQPYLMMHAITPGPGGARSVADLLKRGALDPGAALKYALQLSIALVGAAGRIKEIVHGDLKPENVLLIGGDAFLADFGLVSAAKLGRADNRLSGTLAYRAPELWADETSVPTVSSDVYAFGTLLFEMLTGRTPFVLKSYDPDAWALAHRNQSPQRPPSCPADGLPAALMDLALSCLEKESSARPHDFRDVLARINAIGEEHAIIEHLMLLMSAHNQKLAANERSSELRDYHIGGLLAMGEPGQALDELDALKSRSIRCRALATSRHRAFSSWQGRGSTCQP